MDFFVSLDTHLILLSTHSSLPLIRRVSIEVVKKELDEELSVAKNKQGIVKKEIKEVIIINL